MSPTTVKSRVAVAVLISAFLFAMAAAARAEAARLATAKEQRALVSEAVYYLRILARSGTALFGPGLKVVVQRACVSTADPAFALVTLFALTPNARQVLDPGQLWMGRFGSGPPRAVGPVLLADLFGKRPTGVSQKALLDTRKASQCAPQNAEMARRVKARRIRIHTV